VHEKSIFMYVIQSIRYFQNYPANAWN